MTFMEIKRHRNHFTFVWAITHLMDIGIKRAKEISDKDIEIAYLNEQERQAKMDGICMYTPEVTRDMLITTRELAQLPFEELINGIVVADFWKAHNISWDRMCEITSRCIDGFIECDEEYAYDYFRDEIELEYEEAEFFGIKNEEEE